MAIASSVPRIDLTRDPRTLQPGTQDWDLASRRIREALESYGCFFIIYDVISVDEKESSFKAMDSLFSLPIETQRNIEKMPRYNATYHGHNPRSPLLHALGVWDAQDPQVAQAFTDLMWPDGNPEFCQMLNTMTAKMLDLAHTLMKMIFHSFGVDYDYESRVNTSDTLLQMLRYSPPMNDEPSVGVWDHVDASFLTILYQNEVNGLLSKSRNGECIQINTDKSEFLVQTGVSFKAWSNGRLHVPPHVVMVSGDKVRWSCGLFFNAKPDQIIVAPDELVDDEHPRRYKPIQFGEFYKFFKARGAAEDSLDAYAGI